MPFTDDVVESVAASLLRQGSDAVAARLYNTLPPDAGAADLAERLGIPPARIRAEVTAARHRAAEAITRAKQSSIWVLTRRSPAYPTWLAAIVDPPIVLWGRGNPSLLERPAVALVGSRRPSATSVRLAQRLARDLARVGLVVTSGLAAGIDGAAHQGALEATGATVAVLGCGADVAYPRHHAELAEAVAGRGCLVSEFPPGTPPRAYHFPLRNRIISGLSRVLVVVEAAERSGSLITARMALEQGRTVAAVPGCTVSGCHKGCHALIKDGARLVETVEDVLDELAWSGAGIEAGRDDKSLSDSGLLAYLDQMMSRTVDDLVAQTARQASELLAALTALELDGRVRRMPGGGFVRVD